MAKLSAALPMDLSECAILPLGTPLFGSPASRKKLSDLATTVGALRSDPHSIAGMTYIDIYVKRLRDAGNISINA